MSSTAPADPTHKRKRPAEKPVSKSKKLKRAAAYHSSSSEGEDEDEGQGDFENDDTTAESDQVLGAQRAVAEGVNRVRGSLVASAPGGQEEGVALGLENLNSAAETRSIVRVAQAEEQASQRDQADNVDGSNVDHENDSPDADPSDEEDYSSSSETTSTTQKPKSNRHNPSHFAHSLSTILSTKLTTTQRADPLLSRSADAAATSRAKNDSLLEVAAKRRMRAEKVAGREKGRVRDVLGTGTGTEARGGDGYGVGAVETDGGESVVETERRLKRTAQRGVVKLFNAVRAAQVGAAEAEEKSKREGTVGVERRKERVDEMSRKGFLDMLSAG